MVKFSFTLLFVCCCLFSFGQKEANVWYFGENAGLDFNSGSPVALSNGAMNTNEGCASIADKKSGQILFYTDGKIVWDRNNNPMNSVAAGDTLLGDYSSTQSGVVIPMPGSTTKFYLFTVDAQAGISGGTYSSYGGLAYSIIDMTLNSGNGGISTFNQKLLTPTTEKLSAVRHCNGHDLWVVTHQWNTDAFYAYLVTNAGVQAPVISHSGIVHRDVGSGQNAEAIGYMKFSPDAKKLALTCYIDLNVLQIFDFNNATGVVSNPITENYPTTSGSDGPYGLSFSPDNSRLYVGTEGYDDGFFTDIPSYIYQYNMLAGNASAILASKTLIASGYDISPGALQIGPDGKIYVATVNTDPFSFSGGEDYLDAIANPNALGAACNYVSDDVFLNLNGFNQSLYGLPDLVESFLIPQYTATLTYPTGCSSNSSLAFIDTTLNGTITVQWNFGDPSSGASNTSSLQNPNHSFSGSGNYTVRLVLANACKSDTFTKIINITNTVLSISAGPDLNICSGSNTPINVTGAPGGTTYSWAPTTGLSCNTCSNPTATPAVTTTYIVTANNNGCTDKDTIIVNVISQIVATLKPGDTTICNGNSVQLQAGGGSGYQWSPTTGLSSATISNPVATPTINTTYTVSVSAGNCPSANKTIAITVNPAPTINAGQNAAICPGDSVTLNATGANINTYTWLPATGLSSATIANPVAKPGSTITYTVTANQGSVCAVTSTVVVSVNTSIVAGVNAGSSICNGDNVPLQATGGSNFQWSPGAGLSDSLIANPNASPTITTTYIVTVSGGSCGSDTASVVIAVNPVPSIDPMQGISICSGGNAQLNATGTNINTYLWSPSATLSSGTISNPVATPTTTSTYTLTVNAGTSCTATSTVIVTVNTAGNIGVTPDTTLCLGSSATLKAVGGASYTWSPSAGLSNDTIPNPVANPSVSTTYTVSVAGAGCGNAVVYDTVLVYTPSPVSAGSDVTINLGSSTQLIATGQAVSYSWSPYYFLNAAYISNPVATPTVTTTFTVFATDQYGCRDSSSVVVNVVVLPYIVYPGAFSPNADGINDLFVPHYYEIQSMHVEVFDRWGAVVFQSNNPDVGWDGTFNGRNEPIGVYAYYVKAVTDGGETLLKKGNVTLLR